MISYMLKLPYCTRYRQGECDTDSETETTIGHRKLMKPNVTYACHALQRTAWHHG